jgi:uroporphyrinogen decarboxylase
MPQPDYTNIVNAALNRTSNHIPLYEHSISTGIMETITGTQFAALASDGPADKVEFFRHYCGFFRDQGYDTVSWECCAGHAMPGSGAFGGHTEGAIKTRADNDAYPWDALPDLYFEKYGPYFQALAAALPPGMKAVGGVGNGVFECVQDLVGFEQLCYIKADDADLYRDLFAKVGSTLHTIWQRFLREWGDLYCVCRFGDDLGYKSNTLLAAADLREHVIPQYKPVIDAVHRAGKPFLLHSCGCIFNVMEDLIAAGIDAKHSNEDVIAPYSRWIDTYGDRIGNYGGLDTDVLCASSGVDVASYTAAVFRLLQAKGRGVAIGSGNSIPDYTDPGRYCRMLETVRSLR